MCRAARLFSFIFMMLSVCFVSVTFAKSINLYDQPADSAKVVGTVDMSVGVIPIFSPKEGTWMKVGDPRNGNVGWIKASDIANGSGSPASFSFTQRTVTDSKGVPHSYQIIQYGNTQVPTNQQIKDLQGHLQQQQQSLQTAIQKVVNDFNALSQQQITSWGTSVPVILPIVVMPPQNNATTTPPAPPKK